MKHAKFAVKISARHPEVTGSCFIIEIVRSKLPKETILVDYGQFQGEYENLNSLMDFNPLDIDCVLLSHSHLDHYGLLPMLTKKGYAKNIYCSNIMERSIPIGLYDSAKIITKDAIKLHEDPLYTHADVTSVLPLLKGKSYNKPFKISEYTTVTFIENAHLYGASMIFIEFACPGHANKNFLFTGDYSSKNRLFKVSPIPQNVLNATDLTIVEESTYGSTVKKDVKNNFLRLMIENLNKGQDLLLPVIAQERLEVVLKYISFAQKKKLISNSVKIYVQSTLAKEYYDLIYAPLMKKHKVNNLEFVICTDYETILKDSGQKIILATSGMCENGPIRFYLSKLLPDPHVSVILTNYTADGTLSRQIKDSYKGSTIYISGKPVTVQAKVFWTGCLSSHDKSDELELFNKSFKDVRTIILNHGSTLCKKNQKKKLIACMPNVHIDIIDRTTSFIFKDDIIDIMPSSHLELPYVSDNRYKKYTKKGGKSVKSSPIKKKLSKKFAY